MKSCKKSIVEKLAKKELPPETKEIYAKYE